MRAEDGRDSRWPADQGLPYRFVARCALSALCDVVRGRGVHCDPSALAQSLGVADDDLLTVGDVMTAARRVGFDAQTAPCTIHELIHHELPELVLTRDPRHGDVLLVLTQCDGRYVATRDHSSDHIRSELGPQWSLMQRWAAGGLGWTLNLRRL